MKIKKRSNKFTTFLMTSPGMSAPNNAELSNLYANSLSCSDVKIYCFYSGVATNYSRQEIKQWLQYILYSKKKTIPPTLTQRLIFLRNEPKEGIHVVDTVVQLNLNKIRLMMGWVVM